MGAKRGRDLAVAAGVDALAVAAATVCAFALGTAVHHYDALGLGHIASRAFPEPLAFVAVTLVSLWAAGLYGEQSGAASLAEIGTAVAWAAAPLAFVAFYWNWAPEAPFMVLVAGYVLTTALVSGARELRRRRS